MRRPSNHALRVAGSFALALVLVACFVRFLQSFAYLPGTDAYYYALQAQSLLETGHLKVPDHVPLYYVVTGLARVGLPIEVAFRIALAAIFTLYQAGMLLLVLRVKEGVQASAALLWVLSSPLIAFHTIEFPNLTLALATTPIWFWLTTKFTRRSILLLAAFLYAGAIVHPAAGAIAALFVGMVLLGRKRAGGDQKGRGFLRVTLLVVASSALLLIAVAVANPGIVSRALSFGRGLPGLAGLATSADVPNELKLAVLLLWLLLAILLALYRRIGLGRWRFLAAATLALPLLPDQFAGLAGLGGRLCALFPMLVLPLIIVMGDELAGRWVLFSRLDSMRIAKFAGPALALALVAMPFRLENYRQMLMVDDYPAYEKVVAALREAKVPMLIAHRGLDFFYTYRLRRDAFHFDPESDWNPREIWRVATRITPEELAYYSPPECPWGEAAKSIRGTDYLLVREDCWEQLRAGLTRSDNPDLYAEVWENMENPSQKRPTFLRARHRGFGLSLFSAPPRTGQR